MNEAEEQRLMEIAQRERILQYKRTFGTEDGKLVLIDLCNRFHILNSHKGDPYMEGQRSAVLTILEKCNIDMVKFDKILKGENE